MASHKPKPASAVEQWLAELSKAYTAPGSARALGQRLASWRCGADMAALLFAVHRELQALRADLAAARNQERPG